MLRVLFVNNFDHPDYLSNCVYIGLTLREDIDIHTYCIPSILFKGIGWNETMTLNSRYPKESGPPGFFVSGKIEKAPHVDTPMKTLLKVQEKYYDKIIWGNIWRDRFYLEDAYKAGYKREDMIALDGEDFQDGLDQISKETSYFKREIYEDLENDENFRPISFGIPDFLLYQKMPLKRKTLATIIPGDKSTYIFDNEDSYLKDYRDSYFGKTIKKGGWDCLRHYEILSSRCIPYFPEIENCPKKTLANFPKEIIEYTNSYAKDNKIPQDYNKINLELYQHCQKHLTCSQLINQIFL